MDSDSDSFPGTPPEISEVAKTVKLELLPAKSRALYEMRFSNFINWCKGKKIKNFSESIILVYFSEELKNMRSSSLWSVYSMLRSTLLLKKNVDISKYFNLIAFLKKKSVGYKPKRSKTLGVDDVKKFLVEAPNNIYLMKKVALIFGIFGACRGNELQNMKIEDIEDHSSMLYVRIPETKTNVSRKFIIPQMEYGIDMIAIYKQYVSLRPAECPTKRFFFKFGNNKCTNQHVGKNTLAKIPYDIATFLNLPDSKSYTGHCFRRSSATMLVNGGGDILSLKRHGGWKSSTVAEGYIDESMTEKLTTSRRIGNGSNTPSSTSSHHTTIDVGNICDTDMGPIHINSEPSFSVGETTAHMVVNEKNSPAGCGINIQNCTNCTITFNLSKN